jgi:hypothetical protein
MNNIKRINIPEATEDLDRLYGNGEFAGDMSNPCYRDAYYALELEKKWGMPTTELKKEIGYN